MCPENEFLTRLVIYEVKKVIPDVKIYLWTGYRIEELENKSNHIQDILNNIDFLIDGPYIQSLRDTTLKMRGSSNQRIIDMKEFDNFKKI